MKYQRHTFQLIVALTVLLSIFSPGTAQTNKRDVKQSWATDTSNAVVPLDELWILLKRDRIPPIDEPEFFGREEATEIFFENEPVIKVAWEEGAKAYPLSILTYHEIVNDSIGKALFCVSYCPLCNSSVVFNREVEFEGKSYLLDFGTSGMLRKSNLVMWDRQTETWWQQITGVGLSGELAGAELEMLPSQIISVEEFFRDYPEGLMLSTNTGHDRKYGTNPYEDYDNPANTKTRLFDDPVDDRLPAMERVVHIFGAETPKIYSLTTLREKRVINDSHEGVDVVIFYQDGAVSILDKKEIKESKNVGSVTVFSSILDDKKLIFTAKKNGFRDKQTGSIWTLTGKCTEGEYEGRQLKSVVYGNHFAFAWLGFYPETVIYGE